MHLGSFALLDVLGSGLVPVLSVSFVDGEYLASLGNGHVWVRQDKLSYCLYTHVMYSIAVCFNPWLTGSRVNPLTPCPVERTIMVALPYRA